MDGTIRRGKQNWQFFSDKIAKNRGLGETVPKEVVTFLVKPNG